MPNLAMQRKIQFGEAIDLSNCNRNSAGDYILTCFQEGVDYCDAKTEEWMRSIGKDHATGETLASTSTKFYDTIDYECIWLR